MGYPSNHESQQSSLTIRVRPAQASGSSPAFADFDGTRVSQDWVNIHAAFESAHAGDTICLTPGIYYLNRTVAVDRFAGTFSGEERDQVVIRAIRGADGTGFTGHDDPDQPAHVGSPRWLFLIKTVGTVSVKDLTMEVLDPRPCDDWKVWFYDPHLLGADPDDPYILHRAQYSISNALYGFLRVYPVPTADEVDNEIVIEDCTFRAAYGNAPNESNCHLGVLSNPYHNHISRHTRFAFRNNVVHNVGYVAVEAVTYVSDMDFVAENNSFYGGEISVFAWGNSGNGRIDIRGNTSKCAFWHPANPEAWYRPFCADISDNANYLICIESNKVDPPPENPYL